MFDYINLVGSYKENCFSKYDEWYISLAEVRAPANFTGDNSIWPDRQNRQVVRPYAGSLFGPIFWKLLVVLIK